MNISQIEAFIILAESLNYTKASQYLHTTQPNLSKMIINIEQEIGVQLLYRNKREVKLTQAGETFYYEMNKMMDQYRNAINLTHLAESGISGTLSVGTLGTALTEQLPNIISRFSHNYPNIKLKLFDYAYSELTDKMLYSEVDAAFVLDREIQRYSQIQRKFLFADEMCYVVKNDHPLAHRKSINIKEIEKEKIIILDKQNSLRDFELVFQMFMENNIEPNIITESNTLNNSLISVGGGIGGTIVAHHTIHFAPKNVTFIPIENYEDYFKISFVYKDSSNSYVLKLLDVLEMCKLCGELNYNY